MKVSGMKLRVEETHVCYADADSMAGQSFMVIKDGPHVALVLDRAVRRLPDADHERLLEEAWDAVKDCVPEGIRPAPATPRRERMRDQFRGSLRPWASSVVVPAVFAFAPYAKGIASLLA